MTSPLPRFEIIMKNTYFMIFDNKKYSWVSDTRYFDEDSAIEALQKLQSEHNECVKENHNDRC